MPLVTAVLLTLPITGQITKAPLSPRVQTQQQVGLANVSLDYSRPGVKGRTIFGELEPYGMVWRTGANSSTKITFDRDVKVADVDVPAGTYGLYTVPEKKTWTFILNKNSKLWGAGGYDPAMDQLRVQVDATKLTDLRETLRIDFEGFHAHGADLVVEWEHARLSVPVYVDTNAATLAEIDEKVRNAQGEISGGTYFDAAMYLYEQDRDLDDATAWIAKAVAMSPNAFWVAYYQGEIALHTGDLKLAKAATSKALAMAKASERGDFGYVAKSELLLKRIAKGS